MAISKPNVIQLIVGKTVLWITTQLFVWVALVIMTALIFKQRMSHNKGVAGRGKVKILDNPEIPEHDFFVPGKEFDCRIRHASVTYKDDAMNQVRGASIKFADSRFHSPFDMEMNTGFNTIFWTAANFLYFVWNRKPGKGIQYKEYYRKEPRGLYGAQVCGKHRPSSFSKLEYQSKTPSLFTDKNGNDYYVKYRLIPADRNIDQAPIPEERLETIYDQTVDDDDPNSVNYLVDEYTNRLKEGSIKYLFQIQMHTPSEDDTDEIFNSFLSWDDTHPWLDLAEVTIDEALSYEESVVIGFNIKNHPKSLGLLPSYSIHDYNSVSYMRARTYPAYVFRNLVYKFVGLPKVPTETDRNTGF
jgi:arachidonate 5-lipoxygenase